MKDMLRRVRDGKYQCAELFMRQDAVSPKMVDVGLSIINEFKLKGTHMKQYKTVKFGTFQEYKEQTLKKTNRTILEDWVLGIESVNTLDPKEYGDDGYIVHHRTGTMVLPFRNLKASCYSLYGSDKPRELKFDNKSNHWRHLVDRGRQQTSVSYERLVLIADGIYKGHMPLELRGLQCNVKDCTGNPDTAKDLGIQQDFRPFNLEWVFGREHGAHADTCKKAFLWTGRAWRISALDDYLYELVQSGTKEEVIQYLDWFCETVR